MSTGRRISPGWSAASTAAGNCSRRRRRGPDIGRRSGEERSTGGARLRAGMKGRAGALLLAVATAAAVAADDATIEVAAFSRARPDAGLPAGWEPLTFPGVAKRTAYRLVEDAGTTVLRADADGAGSGLLRRSPADPRTHPVLAWRWKIAGIVADSDATRKYGDDYAARVYVMFKHDPRASPFSRSQHALMRLFYGEDPPHAGLVYVWDNRHARGAVLPNPYSERMRMVVVRSGNADAGRWLAEERNVLDDYRRAFGEEPPAVGGVAVMTDTDDTGA